MRGQWWTRLPMAYLPQLMGGDPHGDWAATIQHLTWTYGAERTRTMLLGLDPRANLDVWRWRQIGRP